LPLGVAPTSVSGRAEQGVHTQNKQKPPMQPRREVSTPACAPPLGAAAVAAAAAAVVAAATLEGHWYSSHREQRQPQAATPAAGEQFDTDGKTIEYMKTVGYLKTIGSMKTIEAMKTIDTRYQDDMKIGSIVLIVFIVFTI